MDAPGKNHDSKPQNAWPNVTSSAYRKIAVGRQARACIFAKHSPKISPVSEPFEVDAEGRRVGLRGELAIRNLQFAASHGLVHQRTRGQLPSVIYGPDVKGGHGNFHPAVYPAIVRDPMWSRRLDKVHTAAKRCRTYADWPWKELDCANSSDALLMNIFCYPRVTNGAELRSLLGTAVTDAPEFGYKPRTPLSSGRFDNTEIDMKLGGLLVEAKLTESDFQSARESLVGRYRDLDVVFDREMLVVDRGRYRSYQLIRGALAAYATGCAFCVLCDARRPELTERWFEVIRAIRLYELRCRLQMLTWQELCAALPRALQEFLQEKYGIVPRQRYGG